jgi:hypothetical protein
LGKSSEQNLADGAVGGKVSIGDDVTPALGFDFAPIVQFIGKLDTRRPRRFNSKLQTL